MRESVLFLLLQAVACGDNRHPVTDASFDAIAHQPDAAIDGRPADAPRLVRVHGNVNYNGSLSGVTVSAISAPMMTTTTDTNGDFFFDYPEGSRLIMEVRPTAMPGLLPMIRGVVAADDLRPRVFYLAGPSDVQNASNLGISFDPAKAIVEIDFRNAAIGGYAATLADSGTTLQPAFGIAYDGNGDAQVSQTTLVGGDGTTLLLGGLPAEDVMTSPVVPAAATLPCQPRDANPLPLRAGTVTWFDYECGNAMD